MVSQMPYKTWIIVEFAGFKNGNSADITSRKPVTALTKF